jgi:hypothetical protein
MRSALTHPRPHGGRSSPNARSPGPNGRGSPRTLDVPDLATRVRLADGRVRDGAISPERHRRLHLGLLHSDSDGYVEVAAGRRPPGGKLRITTRRDAGHFLPGGASGGPGWLDALLALVDRHAAAGDEICVAPAVRHERAAAKPHVAHTNWLWIDVDGADGLPVVRRLLRHKPAHLVIESLIILSRGRRRCLCAGPVAERHVVGRAPSTQHPRACGLKATKAYVRGYATPRRWQLPDTADRLRVEQRCESNAGGVGATAAATISVG